MNIVHIVIAHAWNMTVYKLMNIGSLVSTRFRWNNGTIHNINYNYLVLKSKELEEESVDDRTVVTVVTDQELTTVTNCYSSKTETRCCPSFAKSIDELSLCVKHRHVHCHLSHC